MTQAQEAIMFPPRRDPARPLDPPPQLAKWAAETSVMKVRQWDGVEAWLVMGYADVKSVLADDDHISADPTKPGFPEKSAAYKQALGKDRNVRTLDNPEHAIHQRMLLKDFSAMRVNEIKPAIKARIEGLIDAMLAKGPPADIVTDFALPVPTSVICELLGVPFGDREYFTDRSNLCTSSSVAADVAAAADKDLYDYMQSLIDRKAVAPENDLMSRLIVEQLKPGHLSRDEIIRLGRFILIAGHETTANMIALSTLALLLHPEQADELRRNCDDPAYVANAVEELLRYLSVAHTGRRRVAIKDLVVNGQLIKAGEGVIIANSIADREESVFADADKLILSRPNARQHIAFGHGIHKCIGQLLSRIELQLVHSTLWKRMPTLKLDAQISELKFVEDRSVYGIDSLPVTW